jgi:exodeoxyribonuclease VII small subunit
VVTEGLGDRVERWSALAESGTFEQALGALDEVVALLESGGHGLDDTIAAYEVGTRIARRCDQLLADAELRVSQIAVGEEDRDASAPTAPSGIRGWRAADADGPVAGDAISPGDEPPF